MTSIDSEKFGNYIKKQEQGWLDIFSTYILKEKTLKIGNGFGYLSELVRPLTKELTVLDIQTYPLTINKDAVQIYDGLTIPYPNKSFDTTIIVFTLHHIPQSKEYFQEIMRVTKKRIIILEETYDNIFQKLHLYYRDWIVNKKAEQSCNLYWKSYFSRQELNELIKSNNLIETYRLTKKHKSYFKELVILDIHS
jgi:ubiquinone/menaquinone biosynthesis C-methylase UbiE